jgi:ABC-2 type transport system permease protein/ribosome-dependent ATPase
MNWRRVAAVAYKEWREIVRDRIYFLLAFVLPPVLMMVFGYGVTQDVENVALAVVDYDRSALSRDYIEHYRATRYFHFRGHAESLRAADRLLADRRAAVVLVIPEHYEQDLLAGRATGVQALIDGTFTTQARTVNAYVEAINAAVSAGLATEYVARRLGVTPDRARELLEPLRVEVRYLYNQELESTWGVAASMMMFILILTAPLLAALSVVREKETGSIYNIYAATISRGEFLAGKLAPNVLISFVNALVLWAIAVFWFDAPFKGSLAFFLPATLLYVVCTSSIGLLVSTVVRTQQAALMVSVILAIVIAMTFSGMITPVPSLTGATYVIAHWLPAMHYNDIALGAFLKGAGWRVLWWPVLVLALHAAALLAAVYLLFHKRTRT